MYTTQTSRENLRDELLRNLAKLNQQIAALTTDARVVGAGAVAAILRDVSDDVFNATRLLASAR